MYIPPILRRPGRIIRRLRGDRPKLASGFYFTPLRRWLFSGFRYFPAFLTMTPTRRQNRQRNSQRWRFPVLISSPGGPCIAIHSLVIIHEELYTIHNSCPDTIAAIKLMRRPIYLLIHIDASVFHPMPSRPFS